MNHGNVNGLDFAYLEQGEGPLVLLLHGFPDTANTWSHQMPALANAGYRAVAPFLRGYQPTEVPDGGYFGITTLVSDIAEIIRCLSGANGASCASGQRSVRPVHFIGQDWGAIIGYALIAAHPELIDRAVVAAVPHSGQVKKSLLDAKHIQRSFHWWFFQIADLPEQAIVANNFAFIDYLWDYWTSPGFKDPGHLAEIKATLSIPGVLPAALGYYRAMLNPDKGDPELNHLLEKINRPISVPTLALCGGDDLRAELMTNQDEYFTGEYRYEEIPNAGHFLHREQPAAFNELMLQWLGTPAGN